MISTDGGQTYKSLPSANGYTTPGASNPKANGCQTQYGNGITGTSGSTRPARRRSTACSALYPAAASSRTYDLSSAVGNATVLRFSYSTDPGLARPGWFIDDLTITAGDDVIYETDFESSGDPDDPRVFNGGCKETLSVADTCTERLAVRRRRRGLAGRPRLLPRDARPLGLRHRRQGRERPRSDRVPARACSSSTPTRRTATGTSAPTIRRRRARSTPSPARQQRRRT